MAKGRASVTQKVAIINITYAHLKACKKIKERAFRLNTELSEPGAGGNVHLYHPQFLADIS